VVIGLTHSNHEKSILTGRQFVKIVTLRVFESPMERIRKFKKSGVKNEFDRGEENGFWFESLGC